MRAVDLNPEWFSRTLSEAGVLKPDVQVGAIDVRRIGTGQVADSFQVSVRDADETELTSVVAKLSSDSDQSRAAGRSELNYLREVRFYQEVASRLSARIPQCFHAEIDSNNTEFALLLEDLSPARAGNQLEGCTVDETALALRQAARFHAPYWGGQELVGAPWLDISSSYWPRFEQMLPEWFDGFVTRYRERLTSPDLLLGTQFVQQIGDYYARLRRMPFTVQHGDFRPDNMLFDVKGQSGTIAVVDWQTVILGPGAIDVAYFVGGALDADTRRTHEAELVTEYHAELCRLGVSDYPLAALLQDYAVATFHNFIIGVAAAMLVERSDRGDDLFVSMVTSALDHARDRGGLSALGALSSDSHG